METISEAKNRLESTSMLGANGFYRGVLWAEQWISVEDELPKEDDYVLSVVSGHTGDEAWVVMSLYYKAEFNNNGNHKISHWRPISHL